jgi:hypothetical protein
MMRFELWKRALLGWLIVFPSALAQEKPFSGVQPGESIEPFKVLAVNGADAGREVDYISRFGNSPVFLIFLHQLDRNVAAFLHPCERFAQDRAPAGLKTLIVYLAADKIEAERRMRAVIGSLRLESLVGVSLDGLEGPGAYGLNKEVAVTAIVAKDRKVSANFAIVQPGTVDAPKVMAAVAQHVGGRVLTAEEIQAERARARPAAGMAQEKTMGNPAGEGDPPELANLLRSLIRLQNTRDDVDQASRQLRAWAGTDEKRRALLAQKLTTIIPLQYGTEYARAQMAVLREEMQK